LRQLVARYREPLVRSAYDLQARLYNSVNKGFLAYLYSLDNAEKSYAIENTLFLIAEYLGWVEILRRQTEFLDMTGSEDLELTAKLLRIDVIFSGGDDCQNRHFRLYRG
jgi:glutathionyl-hydroquinone reductase